MTTLREMIDRLGVLRTKSSLIELLKEVIIDEDFEKRTCASPEAIDDLLVDVDSKLLAPVMEEIEVLEGMEVQSGQVEKEPAKKGRRGKSR